MQPFKYFADQSELAFGRGAVDDWCVYLSRPGVPWRAPRDAEYFADLAKFAAVHGAAALYADFVAVYERTTAAVEPRVLNFFIDRLASKYGADAEQVNLLLTLLYAGMLAEENKAGAPLGKRLKRLGVHQILIEGMAPAVAADWSRGKPWRELERACRARGF